MNTKTKQGETAMGYIVNEKGEEIEITEAMIEASLSTAESICLGSENNSHPDTSTYSQRAN